MAFFVFLLCRTLPAKDATRNRKRAIDGGHVLIFSGSSIAASNPGVVGSWPLALVWNPGERTPRQGRNRTGLRLSLRAEYA